MSFRDPRCFFAALVLLCACSNQKTAAAPYAFNRPEHLGFVCLDPDGSATRVAPPANPEDKVRPLVLPLACCALSPVLSSSNPSLTYEACPKEFKREGVTATLHALITQSTRGEIAAVDLLNNRVIDNDILVPGFTFVDVGGLPTAIVVPTERPLLPGAGTDTPRQGPPWTYVASSEELHVRAVATCRFRVSGVCGPERGLTEQQLKVPLPSPPADMVFAHDALWVTMPDLGLIARIDLSTKWKEPFKFGADNQPLKPTFFALRSVGDIAPKAPVQETDVYQASCGLGYAVAPGLEYLQLPLAPQDESTGTPRPSKMHLDTVDDLLLVADQGQGAVRAFTISDARELVPSGVLATGAPVRDFTLTPEVPALVSEEPFTHLSELPDPDAPTVRYLYGIDDRDGSVFIHTFTHGAGGVSSQPLLVPNARRYADRLEFGSPALALDAVDTRALSEPYCGQVDDSPELHYTTLPKDDPRYKTTLTYARDQAKANLKAAQGTHDADKIAQAQTAYNEAEARFDIADGAGGFQLRGVFVAITATDAELRIVDVHDLDAPCRIHDDCGVLDKANPADVIHLRTDVNDAAPVAVRRHAVRLDLRADQNGSLSSDDAFVEVTCPDDYRAVITEEVEGNKASARVCVANDPRRTRTDTWGIAPEGVVAATLPGYLAQDDDGSYVLYANGEDLCQRGVEYAGMPGREKELGQTTDSVVIRTPSTVEGCPPIDVESPTFLPIQKAFSDRLVLAGTDAVKRALDCYPDAPFYYDVRATGQYLVTAANRTLDHRVTVADDGACEVDTTKDPLLHGRIAFKEGGYERFTNAFVSFQLADKASKSPNQVITFSVSQTTNLVQNLVFDPAQGRRDALPVTVQYLPYTDNIFVVDSASQGLRIFTLSPFYPARTSFR